MVVLKQCPHLYLRAEEGEGVNDKVLPLLIREPLIKGSWDHRPSLEDKQIGVVAELTSSLPVNKQFFR